VAAVWQDISGETAESFLIPATTLADDSRQFRCDVTNAAGNTMSNVATLTVNMAPPTITTHPIDLTVLTVQTASFAVVATGSGTLTYQWKKDGVDVTGGIGGTTADYTTPAAVFDDDGALFVCVVTNAGGSTTSNAATLSVGLPDGRLIERVSVDSAGLQGNDHSSRPSISLDGGYVAFHSGATDLVAGDTNGMGDVFVHNRLTGETTRVSVDSAGLQGNDHSLFPSISADGRYVAFKSYATNLVAGDTNGALDVFVHDRQTNMTTRVSVDSSGIEGTGSCDIYASSISADGRYVAFKSSSSNLVTGDTNGAEDVFVHDRQTGATTRVSVDSDGVEGDADSQDSHTSISADGRYVVFSSYATNLVVGDTNGRNDIFVHDRATGETTRVSVASDGSQTSTVGSTVTPSISADGRYVAFGSECSDLVAGDTNSNFDIFVHDRQTGETTRVSVASDGTQASDNSFSPSISADGRYVAFSYSSGDLVADDTNSSYDIFIHDRQTGETMRASIDSGGAGGSDDSNSPSISADGRYVVFHSAATDLVVDDTNAASDVFAAPNPLAP